MLHSISFSGCSNGRPWTRGRLDHIVVCSKKKPPNNGYPGRGRRPRKNYPKSIEDEIDISPLYDDRVVTEIPRGFVVDCTKHINKCVEEGNLHEAQEVFDLMIKKRLYPNVVTYTTLMKGYSRAGDSKRVFELFKDMKKDRVRPDEKTFNTVIPACASTGDLHRALFLFDRMKHRYGLTPDVYTYSAMFNVCASAKDLETAKEICEEMISSETKCDAITLATMLDVYAECCNKDNARQHLKECRDLMEGMELEGVKANLQGLSTLLKLCARGSLTMEAMELLEEMTTKNIRRDALSYSTVIDGISKDETLSDEEVLELSKGIVSRMKQEEIPLDAHAYTDLINVALRVKDLNRAVGLFDEMKNEGLKPNVTTFGIMIKCYGELGDPSDGDAYLRPCLDLVKECEQSGLVMDLPGYTSLLSACANVASLDTASKVLSKMIEAKRKPDVFVYSAMISVCLSSDEADKAFDFLDEMKTSDVKPNEVTFGTFISHFIKKKDRSGVSRILDEMKTLGMQPEENTLRKLRAFQLG